MIVQLQADEDTFDSLNGRLFDFTEEMTRRSYYRFSRSASWQPPVNIYEDADRIYICAELAGLAKEQIQVDVSEKKIQIRGDRAVPPPPESIGPGCVLRMEINSGAFERAIELPDIADTDKVQAELIDGFLWITVDKKAS